MKHVFAFSSPLARKATAVAALLALATLPACESMKRGFGLEHNPPDEFAVSRNPPLTIPPDYNLRPPQPGAPNPGVTPPRDAAAEAVLGSGAGSAPASAVLSKPTVPATATALPASPGEQSLLDSAQAHDASPQIRSQLSADAASAPVDSDSGLADKLLFWKKPVAAGQVVDAQKEDDRLKQNADAGQPVTTGDTPIIERRAEAPLEDLVR